MSSYSSYRRTPTKPIAKPIPPKRKKTWIEKHLKEILIVIAVVAVSYVIYSLVDERFTTDSDINDLERRINVLDSIHATKQKVSRLSRERKEEFAILAYEYNLSATQTLFLKDFMIELQGEVEGVMNAALREVDAEIPFERKEELLQQLTLQLAPEQFFKLLSDNGGALMKDEEDTRAQSNITLKKGKLETVIKSTLEEEDEDTKADAAEGVVQRSFILHIIEKFNVTAEYRIAEVLYDKGGMKKKSEEETGEEE
ncbi:MAG: hypothetical protein AAB071_01600 [Bacteroidota bacterium]